MMKHANGLQAQKQAAPNWRWCPAEGCGHGHLHKPRKSPWVSCSRCHTKICFKHQRLWHTGMTCQEFDAAGDEDQAEAKNVLEIKRTTKPCPFCKIRIKKEGGCNYVVCASCRKNWMCKPAMSVEEASLLRISRERCTLRWGVTGQ